MAASISSISSRNELIFLRILLILLSMARPLAVGLLREQIKNMIASNQWSKFGGSRDLRPLSRPPEGADEPRPGQHPALAVDRGLPAKAVRRRSDGGGSRQTDRGASSGDRAGELFLSARRCRQDDAPRKP